MNSLYGNMRTRTFSNIFGNAENFVNEFTSSGLYNEDIDVEHLKVLFYQLYASYGNSHIASSDENQFKYKMWAIIANKGPAWQKALIVQKKLRHLSEDQIMQAGKYISSHAYNPGEGGTLVTNGEEILNYVNEQNATKQSGNYTTAYFNYLQSLQDVSTAFIKSFKVLFLTIVNPELPLWYEEDDEPEEPIERILELGDLLLHSVEGYTDVRVVDADIKPENIKQGVNILGVEGTLSTECPLPDLREVTVKSDSLTQEILPEGFDGFDRVIVEPIGKTETWEFKMKDGSVIIKQAIVKEA